MVIWPKEISSDDEGWVRACALLNVLALDPRQPSPQGFKQRVYFESADDFLIRPQIWVDRKRIPAPYYAYALRFNVSASVHGTIPIDAAAQLAEFKRRVNAALHGPLTVAARKQWEANGEFLNCCRSDDAMAPAFAKVAADENQKADRYYIEMRETIEAPRRYTGYVAASLSQHEEILEGLIRLGAAMHTA